MTRLGTATAKPADRRRASRQAARPEQQHAAVPAGEATRPAAADTAMGTGAGLLQRLPAWLRDRDTWILINATGWMLVALYLVLFGPV